MQTGRGGGGDGAEVGECAGVRVGGDDAEGLFWGFVSMAVHCRRAGFEGRSGSWEWSGRRWLGGRRGEASGEVVMMLLWC